MPEEGLQSLCEAETHLGLATREHRRPVHVPRQDIGVTADLAQVLEATPVTPPALHQRRIAKPVNRPHTCQNTVSCELKARGRRKAALSPSISRTEGAVLCSSLMLSQVCI